VMVLLRLALNSVLLNFRAPSTTVASERARVATVTNRTPRFSWTRTIDRRPGKRRSSDGMKNMGSLVLGFTALAQSKAFLGAEAAALAKQMQPIDLED
jgi:hypothetical protein